MSEGGPTVVLAWAAAADREPGESWRHETTALTGVMSLPLADGLSFHANLGWSHSRRASQSSTRWALAVEQATAYGLDVMAELFDDDRARRPWAQVGLRWTAAPDTVFVDASYGLQSGHTRRPRGQYRPAHCLLNPRLMSCLASASAGRRWWNPGA